MRKREREKGRQRSWSSNPTQNEHSPHAEQASGCQRRYSGNFDVDARTGRRARSVSLSPACVCAREEQCIEREEGRGSERDQPDACALPRASGVMNMPVSFVCAPFEAGVEVERSLAMNLS